MPDSANVVFLPFPKKKYLRTDSRLPGEFMYVTTFVLNVSYNWWYIYLKRVISLWKIENSTGSIFPINLCMIY